MVTALMLWSASGLFWVLLKIRHPDLHGNFFKKIMLKAKIELQDFFAISISGGTDTWNPIFGYHAVNEAFFKFLIFQNGADQKCCWTLKNNQMWQKLPTEWRKTLCYMPSTHFSKYPKPESRVPVPSLKIIQKNP